MVKKRGREGASAGAWRVTEIFLLVFGVARRGSLCVCGMLDDEGQGAMVYAIFLSI